MSYSRPKYQTLLERIKADLAMVPEALRTPLATAWAQACNGVHGYLDWIDAQCSPLTCDLERLYDWAALYGVDHLLATAASGEVVATGNAGAQVLANTLLRGQNGLDYAVMETVSINGATSVSVRCATKGAAGNLVAGQELTLIDPAPGVNSAMAVGAAGLSGGADDEQLDAWRQRVADEWVVITARGARSGKDDDYRFWARSAHPSVTTALVQTHVLGVGTVIVRPICNTLVERMPTQAVLDAVAANLADIAPATADWRVVAPLKRAVDVRILLAAGIDTAANRAAIESAVRNAVLAEMGETSVLGMAEIDAAVAMVTTQYTRLAPLADLAVQSGEVLVFDSITWG